MARRSSGTATLNQVAKMAGVSEMTVSRVLRNVGSASPATRARIETAVRQTGYVHNRLAGSLATARSGLVGVILPSIANSVFSEVMDGINATLARSGLQAVVGVTDYDQTTEEALIRSMLSWKPEALIVTGLEHTSDARRMLDAAAIRVIEMMDIDHPPIDIAIGLSHRAAGSQTGRYLFERGYRRFGYVGDDLRKDTRARSRRDGLAEFLRAVGLPPAVEIAEAEPSSLHLGKRALARLLARHPEVDVVVFSNDDMAAGGLFYCMEHSIDVPGQLGLFGFNGLEIGQAFPKPLSTIRTNRQKMGALAMEQLMISAARPNEPTVIDTGFELVPGATT
jgi:LacI family gluconate utilization system Gnt-I transcriptional repressor